MVHIESLLGLIAYSFVMTITPGPNNVLLLSSGLRFGLRRTWLHVAGIIFGTLLMIGLVGAGLGELFTQLPSMQIALKLIGSAYMLWLARRLWLTSELQGKEVSKPIGFVEAALFQPANPKVWLMAITVNAAFVPAGDQYAERVVVAALVLGATAIPCISLWAAGGAGLRTWIHSPTILRRVNRAMATISVATLFLFWK